jgi:hypothetical protein
MPATRHDDLINRAARVRQRELLQPAMVSGQDIKQTSWSALSRMPNANRTGGLVFGQSGPWSKSSRRGSPSGRVGVVGCGASSSRLSVSSRLGAGQTDAGITPSWRRTPHSSWTSQASAILPSATRKMTISVTRTRRPVAEMSCRSPAWLPLNGIRADDPVAVRDEIEQLEAAVGERRHR